MLAIMQLPGKAMFNKELRTKLARLQRHVPIGIGTMEIAGRTWPWFHVADTDVAIDQAIRTEQETSKRPANGEKSTGDPFWASNWESGIALEQDLDRYLNGLSVPQQQCGRVLELGCGSGFLSLGCSIRGFRVLATDVASDALLLAKCNSLLNDVPLDIRRIDWHSRERLAETFPLILAADVVYDTKNFVALESFLRRNLSPTGMAVFAEPNRNSGHQFVDWMLTRGWRVNIRNYQSKTASRRQNRIRFIEISANW